MSKLTLYAIPLIPLYLRIVLVLWFRSLAMRSLKPDEQERETHRTHILAFIGFAFTALCAIAIVDEKLRTGLHWAIYYLLVSFFAFVFALNWVAYKGRRWEDTLTMALIEIGTLSIILAVTAVIFVTQPDLKFVAYVALAGWALDHLRRFYLEWNYFRQIEFK